MKTQEEWKEKEGYISRPVRPADELHPSERRYHATLNSMPDAIHVVDRDLRILFVNTRMTGWLEELGLKKDVEGLAMGAAFPFFSPRVYDEYLHVFGTGETVVTEETITAGYREYFTETRKIPVVEEGQVATVVTVVRDLTDMRKARAELVSEKNKLQSLIDSLEYGLTIQDRDYTIIFQNRFLSELFGKVGEKCYRTYEFREYVCEGCPVELSFADGMPHTTERRVLMPAGNTIIWENTATPVRNAEGRIVACIEITRDITERKQAQEEMEENKEYAENLFRSSIIAQVVMDAETGVFIDCNEAAVRIYGYGSREEVLGKTPVDVSTPTQYNGSESAAEAKKQIDRGLRDGSHVFEWRHQRPDGQIWDADVHLMFFRHKGRAFIHFTLQDITERKKAVEALRQAEEKYRKIFEKATEGIYQAAPDGRYLNANPALARMFGFPSPEEMKEAVTDLHQLYVDREEAEKLARLLAENGAVEQFEARLYRKDGTTFWASVNTHVVRGPDGDVLYYEGTNEDITVRKQAEDNLKMTNQRLLDIIDFLPDATFVIDDKKRVTAWNRACEEMTGVGKETIMGKGDYGYAIPFYGEPRPLLIDFVTAKTDDLESYKSVTRKGGRLYGEAFVPVVYGGRGAYLAGHAAPLCDRDGALVGAIESVRDITEFKRLEATLRQSQKMEAIGTLAGGVAHDFNNILTALVGYAALLKMTVKDTTALSYVEQVLSASQKATDLVRNLLAFSRQQEISLKPVSIHHIVKETEKLLNRLLTEDITIRTIEGDEDVLIMADVSQIDQILFNLAANARDAMPQGGTFTLETRAVVLSEEFCCFHGFGEAGRYALLSISDTGMGMDETTKERVFEPFFTTKELGKGTGLGLATVYGIVKQHNGYITVYSEPMTGTTFHLYFPAVAHAVPEQGEPAVLPGGGSETILVAEDNEAARSLIARILSEYGYTIVEAVNGADAVEQFRRVKDIDLLIFDSVMPRMNGREAYEEIRKLDRNALVIFTSGYTRDVFLDKGVEDKRFHFLPKPILPDALLREVRKVLDGRADPE